LSDARVGEGPGVVAFGSRSVGHFEGFDRGRDVGVIWVVAQDVVLDLVVVLEPKFAIRALPWSVGHGSVVAL